VPTVDGANISVEVGRPAGATNVPIILTYSPYNSLSDPAAPGTNIADHPLYAKYGPKGCARAHADVIGTQSSHGTPARKEHADLLERFFERTLKGVRNGIENEPPVWTEGRDATAKVKLKTEESWPPPGTHPLALSLTRDNDGVEVLGSGGSGEDTCTDMANTSEESARA